MLIQHFLLTHFASLVLLHGAVAWPSTSLTFSSDKAAIENLNNFEMGTMGTELMHFNHERSSLRVLGKHATMLERLAEAGKHSHKRAEFLFAKIRSKIERNHENAATLESTLTFNNIGGYMMVMSLGSPPIEFQVIFDTGSSLSWVRCKRRRYKGVDIPSFNPSNSSTYKVLPCQSQECQTQGNGCHKGGCIFNNTYDDGSSLSGSLAYDTLTMTTLDRSPQKFNFAFGCANDITSGLGNVQGLVGSDRSPISLPSQLSKVIQNKFSYCLVPFYYAHNLTSSLKFGAAAQLNGATVNTTPFMSNGMTDEFYSLNLLAITLGNATIHLPPQNSSNPDNGTIIDSGTTYTYVTTSVFADLEKAFRQATSNLPSAKGDDIGLDLCVNVRGHENYDFPQLILHFDNASMHLPKENYLIPLDPSTICLNMLPSDNTTIIGNIYQQNFEILYDNGNSSLSFASKDCSSASSFSSPQS